MARSADPQLRRWWRKLIDSFDPQRSTVIQFCRRHEVSVASFYQWRRKLAEERPSPKARRSPAKRPDASPAFLPVQLTGPAWEAAGQPIQVHLPNGVRVELPADCQELLWQLIGANEPARKEAT